MKEFLVTLVKSYAVKILAENATDAKRCAEFFTGDITDVSAETDRNEFNFVIEEIESVENDAVWVEEINE